MNQQTRSAPAELPPPRRYVYAADVAQACGLSVYQLDTAFRPDDWALPRDFTLRSGRLLLAIASLHRLADCIQARGAVDAAILVRDFRNRLPEASPVAENRLVPVQRELVERSEDELQRELAGRAHPSDRESARFNWEEA